MIIPHSEEATYSLSIPLYIVKVMVVLVVLFIAGLCVLGYSYMKAAAEVEEIGPLREANRAQQDEINALAIETQRLMKDLRNIDEIVELFADRLELDPYLLDPYLNDDQQPPYVEQGDPGESVLVEHERASTSDPEWSLQDRLLLADNERTYLSRSSSGGLLERAAGNIEQLKEHIPDRSEALDVLGDYLAKLESTPSIWPARGRIYSGFGMRAIPYARSGYQFHAGVDISGAHGSEIWAAANGVVVYTGYRGAFGNLVIIDHGYGFETYYAHLSGFAVITGDMVNKGDVIGYMGATGRTTGTHLHYEVHVNGSPVNPVNYMKHE